MMENNSDSGYSDFEVESVEDEEYSQVLLEEGHRRATRISTDYSLIMNETHNCFFDTNFSTDPNMSFLTQIIKFDIS